MMRTVDERPEASCRFRAARLATQESRTDPEENSAAQLQAISLSLVPRKRIEQRQPCILELREFVSAYRSGQQLAGDRLQSRLRKRYPIAIELLEPLAPPDEADRAEPRIAARRHHIGECQVQIPERRKGRPQLPRQLLERNPAVVIEPALSDR